MATQTVPQVESRVVPFQRPTEVITQEALAEIIGLRQRIESLEAQLAAAEAEVRAQLEAGAEVEAGLLQAYVKTSERRSVSWKAVCERELGDTYCKRVLAATHPDTLSRLIIEA